jgi:hypothetical protein
VVAGDHHREESRPARLAGLDVGGVRALAEVDRLVEVARPPGGLGELLQILSPEQTILVRLPEQLVGIAPGVSAGGVPPRFERVVENLAHGGRTDLTPLGRAFSLDAWPDRVRR